MAKGWHNEPRRHSLASKGVKTAVKDKPLISNYLNSKPYIPIGNGYFYKEKDSTIYFNRDGVFEPVTKKKLLVEDNTFFGEPTKTISNKGLALYNIQDSQQEKIIHSDWGVGYYRYLLEASGDVYRELTRPIPNESYINEKLTRIKEYVKELRSKKDFSPEEVEALKQQTGFSQLKTRIHPEDSYEYSIRNNPEKFKQLEELWGRQPFINQKQELAIKLNKALLKKDFNGALLWSRYLKD